MKTERRVVKTRTGRWLRAALVGVALTLAAVGSAPVASAQAQPACQIVSGFASLQAMVGSSVTGTCLENERSTINGDVLQQTTNGMLVWRKLDNFTAFTNGVRTWIAGPAGIVARSNNERFSWEGDRQAIEELQRGGLIIYLRHGATDRSQADSDTDNLANCATQRNLNDQGRNEGRRIGAALRALNIPVGQVLSSDYCRAREFSELAFGRFTVEPKLVLPDPLPDADRQLNAAAVRTLLAAPPAPRTVSILVSHQTNMNDAMNINLSVEGEAAVFRPDGRGGTTLIARFVPDEWVTMAQIVTGRSVAP
jgi:phosphohistidine phosphatase SixA